MAQPGRWWGNGVQPAGDPGTARSTWGGCHGPQMPGKGPPVAADLTPGGSLDPTTLPGLCWALEQGARWGCGQSPQGERDAGGCPCLSPPFAAGERPAPWSHVGSLSRRAPRGHLHVPPFHQALEGHWGSVPAAAGPRHHGQMSSASVGGKLSVGISGDGCLSVRHGAREPCAIWRGLGSLGPCLAWGSLQGGFPTRRPCCTGRGVPPLAVGSPCAVSQLPWAG